MQSDANGLASAKVVNCEEQHKSFWLLIEIAADWRVDSEGESKTRKLLREKTQRLNYKPANVQEQDS